MSEQSNIRTWPERIYLQHGDAPEVPAFHEVYPGNGYSNRVTRCQDMIEPADVEYVRADLAAVAVCQHRIVDARNPMVKSGYFCPDCGALFAAGDHDAPAQPETWKVLPSPARVTGEIEPQWIGELRKHWLTEQTSTNTRRAARAAVFEYKEQVKARLASTGEPMQEAKE